jgi:hypothetical protein
LFAQNVYIIDMFGLIGIAGVSIGFPIKETV